MNRCSLQLFETQIVHDQALIESTSVIYKYESRDKANRECKNSVWDNLMLSTKHVSVDLVRPLGLVVNRDYIFQKFRFVHKTEKYSPLTLRHHFLILQDLEIGNLGLNWFSFSFFLEGLLTWVRLLRSSHSRRWRFTPFPKSVTGRISHTIYEFCSLDHDPSYSLTRESICSARFQRNEQEGYLTLILRSTHLSRTSQIVSLETLYVQPISKDWNRMNIVRSLALSTVILTTTEPSPELAPTGKVSTREHPNLWGVSRLSKADWAIFVAVCFQLRWLGGTEKCALVIDPNPKLALCDGNVIFFFVLSRGL